MTYEEALCLVRGEVSRRLAPIVTESLEKQIPKKPKQSDLCRTYFYCPNCLNLFNGYHKPHHCKCGQALDWSK